MAEIQLKNQTGNYCYKNGEIFTCYQDLENRSRGLTSLRFSSIQSIKDLLNKEMLRHYFYIAFI